MSSIDKRATMKLANLIKECDYASEAVKSITSYDIGARTRLSSCTNEFSTLLQAAISCINNVIPHIEDSKQPNLNMCVVDLLGIVSTLQQFYLSDLNTLKEKLVYALQGIKREANVLFQFINDDDIFITNEIRNASDEIAYSVYKLKFQAIFFQKEFTDFGSILNEALTQVREADCKILTDSPILDDEVWHVLKYVEVGYTRIVHDLEKWLFINKDNVQGSQIIQEFCDTISKNANTIHKIIIGDNKATDMIRKVRPLYEEGYKVIQGLVKMKNIGLGGEGYIRSVILDAVSLGMWVNDSLEISNESLQQ